MDLSKFTVKCQEALQAAQTKAINFNHQEVDGEHLLLVPVPDLAAGLVDLHARGLRVVGADGDARPGEMARPIQACDQRDACCIGKLVRGTHNR